MTCKYHFYLKKMLGGHAFEIFDLNEAVFCGYLFSAAVVTRTVVKTGDIRCHAMDAHEQRSKN